MHRPLSLTIVVAIVTSLARAGSVPSPDELHAAGKLLVHPHPPLMHTADVGTHALDLGDGVRDGFVHVPPSYSPGRPAGLLLLLHGAGGRGARILDRFLAFTDKAGIIVVAPDSRGHTWDIVTDRAFGTDVAFLDRALAQVFNRYDIDPERIAIGGFSDGASYSLSLGLVNGSLFHRIVAFSPGFAEPTSFNGKPRIFVAHGSSDSILSVDQTRHQIVPALRRHGYDVRYVEFDDDHVLRDDILDTAFSWLGAKT